MASIGKCKAASAACAITLAIALMTSCGKGSAAAVRKSVAVFVPGAIAGSPTYEQLVAGAERAAKEAGAEFLALEAGFDQSAWESKLTELAISGKWGLIASSNPSLPELCVKALAAAPKQKFFIADAYLKGNPNVATVLYNQVEQGYVAGFMAGLSAKAGGAKSGVVAGIIVAQRYPTLDKAIIPGFELGLSEALSGATAEIRVIGNWYDAQKAKELAGSLLSSGAKVLFPIAGGAAQGVISAAQAGGAKVVWFDGTGYDLAPSVVVGCAVLRQEKLVYERVSAALSGKLAYGNAEILGFKEGYVDFDDSNPLYASSSDAGTRSAMDAVLADFRSGKRSLKSPTF
jgi:basic membrane lipoprotein Med (substrate-binding protein (PBP1-ABC) superfamily)